MIENINEIKYPIIVEVADDEGNFCIYESPTSVANLVSEAGFYVEDEPIQEEDAICTKEFLLGKYIRVKCLEEFNFVKKLALNGGYIFNCIYDLISNNRYLAFYNNHIVSHSGIPSLKEELILPFPESIYHKNTPAEEEQPTTEPLSQEFSSPEGDSLAESLHTLSERYTLFYSFHPAGEETLHKKSYFLVDYKDVSYKIDSVAKVGDLEKMIMIERGLCYE